MRSLKATKCARTGAPVLDFSSTTRFLTLSEAGDTVDLTPSAARGSSESRTQSLSAPEPWLPPRMTSVFSAGSRPSATRRQPQVGGQSRAARADPRGGCAPHGPRECGYPAGK